MLVNDYTQWEQALADTKEALLPPSQRPANSIAQIRLDPPEHLDAFDEDELNEHSWDANPAWQLFKMVPHIRQFYEDDFYEGDGYDEHGYTDVVKTHLTIPQGSPQVYGQYEMAITGPTA